jgi:hypothetical protein
MDESESSKSGKEPGDCGFIFDYTTSTVGNKNKSGSGSGSESESGLENSRRIRHTDLHEEDTADAVNIDDI